MADLSVAELRVDELTVDGIQSPLLMSGDQQEREAIVCLHGNPGSSRDWEDLLAGLGSIRRSLAFDLPGFGRADKARTFNYSIEGYARFLHRALEELEVHKAHLIMHDFGGPLGLAWAAVNPGSVASLTFINIGILTGYRWHALARIWRTPVLGELFMATTTRTGFRLLLDRREPHGLPREFLDRMYDDFDRNTRHAVLQLYRSVNDVEAATHEVTDALGGTELPVLVLWGKHDPYIPVEFAEAQRRYFPNAEIRVLENSGHFPFADDPARVSEEIVTFLQKHVTR